LDVSGHVNDVVLVRYMQEAAIEASTDLGFSPDWYRQHHVGWVVRRLSVHYLAPITYGDEVEVNTWISGMRGVRSTREYDVTLVRSGARVARGRAEWVYMDGPTGQPIRIPDEWTASLATTGKLEDLDVRLKDPRQIEDAYRYMSRRRVQHHELDTVQHVNHAVYLNWAGQAYFDALRGAGHPAMDTHSEEWMTLQAGHEVQYFAPTRDNENIEIVSWVCEMSEVGVAWTHEIYNVETRKLLARDYSVRVFVNPESEPSASRQKVIFDLVRGPGQ
jgi:YbgC/YbaW family acyl-CoA thioester hydrolase